MTGQKKTARTNSIYPKQDRLQLCGLKSSLSEHFLVLCTLDPAHAASGAHSLTGRAELIGPPLFPFKVNCVSNTWRGLGAQMRQAGRGDKALI